MQPSILKRLYRGREIILRAVLPVHHDHVLGNVADQIGMMKRNVSPEHQPAIVRLQQIANAIEMFKVNRTDSFSLRFDFALSFAKFEGLVFTDVKKLAGKQFVELLIPIRD